MWREAQEISKEMEGEEDLRRREWNTAPYATDKAASLD
jgi:hypothetical protein